MEDNIVVCLFCGYEVDEDEQCMNHQEADWCDYYDIPDDDYLDLDYHL